MQIEEKLSSRIGTGTQYQILILKMIKNRIVFI